MERLSQTLEEVNTDSFVKGNRPALVEFVTRRGVRLALPYLALRKIEFEPDRDHPLTVTFSSHVIRLKGQGLITLHQLLLAQSLMTVMERSERYMQEESQSVRVTSLQIVPKRPTHPSKGSSRSGPS
jgi:hypothetical protein